MVGCLDLECKFQQLICSNTYDSGVDLPPVPYHNRFIPSNPTHAYHHRPGTCKVDPPALSLQPARCKSALATSRLFHDPAIFRIYENYFGLKKCLLDRALARHRIFTETPPTGFVKKLDTAVGLPMVPSSAPYGAEMLRLIVRDDLCGAGKVITDAL